MGFNNGYESGYDDAKAESAQKIKALEARIAELETESGSPSPGSSPVLSLPVSPRTAVQLLAPGENPVYDTDVVPVVYATGPDEEKYTFDDPSSVTSGDYLIIIVPHALGDVSIPGYGDIDMGSGGIWVFDNSAYGVFYVGVLDTLQNIPLTT